MDQLNPENIDRLDDEHKRELLAWLRELVIYVEGKLGVVSPAIRNDPVMAQIVDHYKRQQRNAIAMRPSWMSTGIERCDDKHI